MRSTRKNKRSPFHRPEAAGVLNPPRADVQKNDVYFRGPQQSFLKVHWMEMAVSKAP